MFTKVAEIYTPHDLVWLQVVYNTVNKHVCIKGKDGNVVEISEGQDRHLDELIAILTHLKSNKG